MLALATCHPPPGIMPPYTCHLASFHLPPYTCYLRAMLTDQTLEEMEQQVGEARSMATNTGALAEDTARQLGVRTRELGHTRDRWVVGGRWAGWWAARRWLGGV